MTDYEFQQEFQKYKQWMRENHHFLQTGTWKDIFGKRGRKYWKVMCVLSNNQHGVIQFIDFNGNVYKANSARQKGRLLRNTMIPL